ncbi:MAG: NAD(P)H-hydrate dehydratase [Lactobacillus sp.]|nr:NAD(P)H-hydrate dehydratase [Lactobacillus sp.]
MEKEIISNELFKSVVKVRPSKSQKGDYGKVLLIGGSEQFGGAIIMATEACVSAGAGLVMTATHSVNLSSLHARVPEAMFCDWRDRNLAKMIAQVDVIVCGPGLGQSAFAQDIMQLVSQEVTDKQTVVYDASALNWISNKRLLLARNARQVIFTPHQVEWQRMSSLYPDFQTDTANQDALNNYDPGAILVLKSENTRVYQAGKVYQNQIGNPGMATGGMGDTLAGVIGAFVAQFGPSVETVSAAIYLHSLVGDAIYQDKYVVRPTELISRLAEFMKH